MAFPSDVLGTHVQLQIDGTWTDVMRYDDDTKILQRDGISIKRGASGLQDRTPPGICTWKWQDPNGIYNNENPRSPYYGLLPRNTPVRVYVPREAPSLYMLRRDDGSRAQTTDKAALDITGDIEIRIDFEPRRFTRWISGQNRGMLLASKYNDTTQRSWYVRFGESALNASLTHLAFIWSTNGTNSVLADCTEYLPTTGRIAIKITMDVDNGAGSREVKFWTSTTGIDGTYTQLGTTVTGSTTSINSGSANLELGTMNGGMDQHELTSSYINYEGRIHHFRLYNGIGGSLVADADFGAQDIGDTSFSDGLGNTWTIEGTAEITDADYRFHGELSAPVLKPKQSADGVGTDIVIEAEAGGILRRLSTNETPLQSPIYLTFSTYGPSGWWTGEESDTADSTTTASSGSPGGNPARISDIEFVGFDSEIPGSAGVMELGAAGSFTGIATNVTATSESHFYMFFKFPSVPVADQYLVNWYSTGTGKRYSLMIGTLSYHLRIYSDTGTLLAENNTSFGSGAEPDNWIAYHSRQSQNGGNIDVTHEWHAVGTDLYYTASVTSFAGTMGRPDKVTINPGSGCDGVRFCHVMMAPTIGLEFFAGTPTTNIVNFARAFAGEYADDRFTRICTLLGVEPNIIGFRSAISQQMGPQPIDTGINILYECAEVDGGKIIEANDRPACLEFRPIRSLYNQYGMELVWSDLAEGLEATPDDTDIANDISSKRAAGGTARSTLQYGAMSIQAPPDGINLVPDGPTFNCYTVEQLVRLTDAALFRRTWPSARYPALVVHMHHPTFAGDADKFLLAQKTEVSDIIRVTDLPLFMAPDELALMATGISEEIHGQEWTIAWALTPYGPFESSESQTVPGDKYSSYVAAHTTIDGVVQQQLNTAIDADDTSISVKTLSGPIIVEGSVSWQIKIGGEVMDVTNVSGSSSPQTLTVARGAVGGFASAHAENDYVRIFPELFARL